MGAGDGARERCGGGSSTSVPCITVCECGTSLHLRVQLFEVERGCVSCVVQDVTEAVTSLCGVRVCVSMSNRAICHRAVLRCVATLRCHVLSRAVACCRVLCPALCVCVHTAVAVDVCRVRGHRSRSPCRMCVSQRWLHSRVADSGRCAREVLPVRLVRRDVCHARGGVARRRRRAPVCVAGGGDAVAVAAAPPRCCPSRLLASSRTR
jgi:hypothetical protein